jgi:aryl-alcohol dehydrogenase-like predicted oxidoreductase
MIAHRTLGPVMQRQPLGRSGLTAAPWAFGGNVFGWTVDRATAFRLLDAFVERGFNLIDTADVYPPQCPTGTSEAIIGEWLAQGGGRRERVLLATKLGVPTAEGAGTSRAYMAGAVERSLRRLQTDVIDLYQAHVDDSATPLEETLGAFDALIRAGKVRAIGASNFSAPRLTEALNVSRSQQLARFETLQPWYNLYDRDLFEGALQELARAEGLSVLPYFGLASGFLTGKYRSAADLAGSARAYRVKDMLTPRGMRILAALDAAAADLGATPAQIALAWLRAKGCVPLASATRLEQLEELAAGVELHLDAPSVARLDAASVIGPGEQPLRAPPPKPQPAAPKH